MTGDIANLSVMAEGITRAENPWYYSNNRRVEQSSLVHPRPMPDDDGRMQRLEAIWAAGQRMWLRLSTRSRMVIARSSGHSIYLNQPSLTLRLIRQAISEAS